MSKEKKFFRSSIQKKKTDIIVQIYLHRCHINSVRVCNRFFFEFTTVLNSFRARRRNVCAITYPYFTKTICANHASITSDSL